MLAPIFEPTFVPDSYACRKGKGTHAAVDRFTHFARRGRYFLHCDVQKYFPSIDHKILKGMVRRKVKDAGVLWLAERIIDHSNPQEAVQEWYPGDDLFAAAERRVGLPLGNQTSQFFANVYLNPLDHFVKETLGVRGYLRYMDDFVLFGDDAGELAGMRELPRRSDGAAPAAAPAQGGDRTGDRWGAVSRLPGLPEPPAPASGQRRPHEAAAPAPAAPDMPRGR